MVAGVVRPALQALLAVLPAERAAILRNIVAGRMRSRGQRSKARACIRWIRKNHPDELSAAIDETCARLMDRADRLSHAPIRAAFMNQERS